MPSLLLAVHPLIILCAASLLAGTASAMTFYSYQTANFDTIVDVAGVSGTYDAFMSISGSFKLDEPLPADFQANDLSPSILSLPFTDGRTTYGLDDINFFGVITDSSGEIAGWNISIRRESATPRLTGDQYFSLSFLSGGRGDIDQALISTCTAADGAICLDVVADQASVDGRGTWTAVTVPEPGTALLQTTKTATG